MFKCSTELLVMKLDEERKPSLLACTSVYIVWNASCVIDTVVIKVHCFRKVVVHLGYVT
jgi:hypothetical protein